MAFALLASTASADTALLAFEFASDTGKVGIYAGPGDIGEASGSFDEVTASPVLRVRLDPAFDPAIAKLTAEHIGEQAQVFICGQLVTEPMVMSAIHSADFVISGLGVEEATRLATLLSDDTCAPPVATPSPRSAP